MVPKKFVILDNRDLATVRSTPGQTRVPFTAANVRADQTVIFDTTDPCVAIMDNTGVQWDLDSKRVWYTSTHTIVDLIDILYAKGLVLAPATFTTALGTYERYREGDAESGYSWRLLEAAQGATEVPPFLYTKVETPSTSDVAYYSNTTTGASVAIQAVTPASTTAITGTWDAIFTVSPVRTTGSTITGITYDIITDR